MSRRWPILRVLSLVPLLILTESAGLGQAGGHLPPNHINPQGLSQGGQAWWLGPNLTGISQTPIVPAVAGANVDAANPNEDLAPGQSETAIAASGNLVMAAWNDATGFFVLPSTEPKASLTG